MNRVYILFGAVLALFLIHGCQSSTEVSPVELDVPMKPVDTIGMAIAYDFNAYFTRAFDSCGCPGAAVSLVKDSASILEHGYGFRDDQNPVDAQTVFRLGSVSKGFAAITAAFCVENNYFSYYDTVNKIVPFFSLSDINQSNRIQVWHLLSHTTGLPMHSYTNLIEDGVSVRDITRKLQEVKLIAKEGQQYAYQNTAYSVIEEVILSSTGKTYTDILESELLKPLDMQMTSFSYEALVGNSNHAEPHFFNYKTKQFRSTPITERYYNSVSSGGINSNVNDMAKWMLMLVGNRPDVLDESAFTELFKPRINTSGARRGFNKWEGVGKSYYAMGWRLLDIDGYRIIYHGGFVNDYKSEIAIDRNRKLGICVLFNSTCPISSDVIPKFFEIAEYYRNSPSKAKRHELFSRNIPE